MLDEFNALLRQGTWSLVPSSSIKMQLATNGYSRSNDALMDQLKHVLSPKGFISSPGSIILTLSVQWSSRPLFAPF